MTALVTALVPVSAVAAALASGMMFIFSNTVMKALARQGAEAGSAAMVAINEVILNPLFFTTFMGTGLLCVATAAGAWFVGHDARIQIVAGAALYVIGMIGVTAAVNVPLNDALAAQTLGTEAAADFWAHYLDRWTRWNSIRTVAGVSAALLLAFAR